MDLAHGVLSGDVKAVKNVLESKKKLNINFRNMGDKGATPLYYSIKQGNREIVELLLENGARLDLGMKDENENDIPMYFAMLALVPRVNNELLKLVTPKGPIGIDHIFYNGKNVLFHCIDHNVHHDVIDYILHIGSAHLVTQYTQDNICARDYAVKLQADKIVQVIDKNVCRWIVEGKDNRKILFLHNYQHIPQVILTKEEEEAFSCLPDYYDQISKFHDAVENSDYETTHYLLDFIDSRVFGILETCLADSRRRGDGQPAIHKAVLRHNIQIVQLLAETLVYQQKQRLDSIRDQSFRTPLHYAYGMENERNLVNLLLDYGASEFTVDKNGHSPLEFKDRRGERLMEGLLEYQYDQYLNEPEPDPWSIPLSIPILGYFLSCSHPTHLSTIIPSKPSSSLTASQRRRSVPEMKLRKIASRSASIASHLANFTEALRSRLAQRSYHRHSTDKEYFPIPSDENKLEEDPDHFLLNGEADDLLTEKEIKKSSSCMMQ
ncbi:hypothetical protein LOTGIDRAFT_166221 [Lottia gigantea]|uniref:Uncharacterized protein n=1 Tax=Lottia gigantea TaxID=225164 RepID=V4A3W7_LOTGI|nr:hypothetical protein LOTGIDRAFT_166221 [Lottia gigantea]ESO87921.1 hypothetical protein LOTGIDRAFT_166221 [Lottia gigantea]